jgi:AraC family transcriptional regulator
VHKEAKMTPSIQVTMKEVTPTTVAFISMKGPFSQMGEAFGKLYAWIGQKGYIPAGPPSGLYFNAPGQVPEDQLLWELRSPIAGAVSPAGPDKQGLGVKRLERVRVAATMHKGPFDGVVQTYEQLGRWIAENGYEVVGPSEEVYLSNPQETPPAELLTEVRFPVRKK